MQEVTTKITRRFVYCNLFKGDASMAFYINITNETLGSFCFYFLHIYEIICHRQLFSP